MAGQLVPHFAGAYGQEYQPFALEQDRDEWNNPPDIPIAATSD